MRKFSRKQVAKYLESAECNEIDVHDYSRIGYRLYQLPNEEQLLIYNGGAAGVVFDPNTESLEFVDIAGDD